MINNHSYLSLSPPLTTNFYALITFCVQTMLLPNFICLEGDEFIAKFKSSSTEELLYLKIF